ncbi:hypothetical protein DQ04_01601140 [Trypanosoma grayi]|uniref:hypothetical protein n=1 Tax=Trypanosoma grayi TaxID=71804 RepID=UPI0004F4B15E|nr:hypothetical protein DQ04_01601140 [Trypanosoma grayi]KEG12589.1 hypothetical protein DQ04_01601140 [Trypanosoma grayi]
MITRGKRGRGDDDVLVEGVSAAIRGMTAEVDDIVGSVATVNGAVLESVLRKSRQVAHALNASGGSVARLWKQLAQSQQSRAAAALSHLRCAEDARRKAESVAALQQQLMSSASLAAAEVSKGLGAANNTAVALFSSQLAGEQATNEQLVSYVRDFLRSSLEALQDYSRRALNAELSLSKNELTAARLRSSLSFYQSASLRHHEEVAALITIVRLLAAKSKDVDLANSDLRQAKAHVRLLEKHLDLAGIVHAIVPPSFVPPRPPPEAPNGALKRTAPEYFALRLLEHKDVTLSELVDSWHQQEVRIVTAEANYGELQASVEALRQEALTVHHSFLEEKRRREVVEHRLVDLVRERIHPSSNDTLVRQLTQLRTDYTRALDDAAQMATALGVTREALAQEQQRSSALEVKMRQMQDDADADEVAHTLASLRRHYETELERLCADAVDADTHSAVAVAHAEVQQEASAQLHDALAVAQRTAAEMSTALQRAEEHRLTVEEQERWGINARAERLVEEGNKAMERSDAHLNKALAAFQMVVREAETQRTSDMATFEQQVAQLLALFESLQPTATDGENTSDVDATALQLQQQREARAVMREALAHALQFVSDELETSDATKTGLLDSSLSDARHVGVLLEKVRVLTAERDAALQQLAKCEQLIDQHSLTAVERVLMHEVSVEESIDAMEASEQIAMLREEVSSLSAVRAAALTELAALQEERLRDDNGAFRGAERIELLERHNARLVTSLQEALTREVALVEQVHQLQHGLQQWAGKEEPADAAEDAEDATAAAPTPAAGQEQLALQLEQLCGGIAEMKEQLAHMQTAMTTRDAPGSGEVEVQLLRNGVGHVATSLREALHRAELLRHALPTDTNAAPTKVEEEATVPAASSDSVTEKNETGEDAVPQNRLAAEVAARDEELTRLRGKLEAHLRTEEELKKAQEDMQQENASIKARVGRLLEINKQLVEELRAVRSATGASPS